LTTVLSSARKLRPGLALGIVALAIAAYIPAQLLPLIADDYVQVILGRTYGPVSAWADLAADALYRCRATSIVVTYWTEQLFGFSPAAFNLTSLMLHVINVLLVAGLGFWNVIGWRISIPAAAFFALAEGHQEAVVWYAALPELLVFAFVMSAFICWVLWIQAPHPSAGARFYLAALALFILALLSKESAVCLIGLQVLAILTSDPRRASRWIALIPFVVLSCVYFAMAYLARQNHLHFNDGTFALSAPFLLTLTNSLGRLLWIWGAVGLALIALLRPNLPRYFLLVTVAWAVLTLLPYSFLTYMPRVPSRHTYLASVALAWIVGATLTALRDRYPKHQRMAAAFALLVAAHNLGYLWTKKQEQYARRAAPTADLIRFAKQNRGPVYVRCFPYSPQVAELALLIHAGESPTRLRWANQPGCQGHQFESLEALPLSTADAASVRAAP
jgi:hypothetical protein